MARTKLKCPCRQAVARSWRSDRLAPWSTHCLNSRQGDRNMRAGGPRCSKTQLRQSSVVGIERQWAVQPQADACRESSRQLLDLDILEFDLHLRPGVNLQGNDSFFGALVALF